VADVEPEVFVAGYSIRRTSGNDSGSGLSPQHGVRPENGERGTGCKLAAIHAPSIAPGRL